MAAALRLLLRRRAEAPSAPSVALLQPLFPRPYSKLSAPPVPSPSLLRRTSGEGCSALLPVPRKPTDRGHETQRPIQPSTPLLGVSGAYNLRGMQRVETQPSPLQVPSLIRHYSSKGCAEPLPLQPIDPQKKCQFLKQAESMIGASNDSAKQLALAHKAVKTCGKAYDLLGAGPGVDDDKAFAMLEKGLDDALNALAAYENNLDVLDEAYKGMQLDIDLEPDRMACKETMNSIEYLRQKMKELQRSHETQRILEKIGKWVHFANFVLEALVLLLLLLKFWVSLSIFS